MTTELSRPTIRLSRRMTSDRSKSVASNGHKRERNVYALVLVSSELERVQFCAGGKRVQNSHRAEFSLMLKLADQT